MTRYAYISTVVCFVASLCAATVLYVRGVAAASDVFKLASLIAVYLVGVHTQPPGGTGDTG